MAPFNYKQEYGRYKKYYQSLTPIMGKSVNQAYTAIIFSFLAVSLFGWYAIRPTMQTIFELKRQITDNTDVDKKMEDKISALIEAQAIYDEVGPSLITVTQALPPIPEAVTALADLQALANQHSVSFVNISVPALPLTEPEKSAKPPAAGKVSDFSVTLTVAGSYPNVYNFLAGVSDLRRVIYISEMAFSPRSESTASPSATAASTQVQVDLQLKLFYLSTI